MAYISTEEVKWVRNKLKKKYPEIKWSVRRGKGSYSTIDVDVMESSGKYDFRKYLKTVKEGFGLKTPSQMTADDYEPSYGVEPTATSWGGKTTLPIGYSTLREDSSRVGDLKEPRVAFAKKDIAFWNDVMDIVKQKGTKDEWYDKSDAMTDYSNTAYYISMGIGGGSGDKIYKYSGKARATGLEMKTPEAEKHWPTLLAKLAKAREKGTIKQEEDGRQYFMRKGIKHYVDYAERNERNKDDYSQQDAMRGVKLF